MASVDETARLLERTPMFAGLSHAELDELAKVAVPRSYEGGQVVFREGDDGDTCFVIRKGAVKITREHGGRTIALAELRVGDMFGELSMFGGEVRSASAQALEPTQAVALLAGDIKRLLTGNPDIAFKMLEAMADRVRRTNERLGHAFGRARDDDLVERRRIGPALVTVAAARMNVHVPQFLEGRFSPRGERLDDLDRVYFLDQPAEHGGLVTAAGANLQDLVGRLECQLLRHLRYDERRRDRLAVADRKRAVGVRGVAHFLGHELLARHLAHCRQHTLVLDAAGAQLALDHLLALLGPVGQ
jgi:CRP-like cAMP-binding protein